MPFGLVIPCYNEALRLKLDAFCDFLDDPDNRDYRICFVNDGSRDNTIHILRLIRRQYPERVEVLEVSHNRGKANAVRRGFLHFLEQPEIEGVGFIDADLSTNFREFTGLVRSWSEIPSGEGMVFGSRPLGRGYKYQRKFTRTVASVIARTVIRQVIGLPVMDSQCGAKVLSTKLAASCFDQPFKTRWLFDVELFLRIRSASGSDSAMDMLREVNLKEWVDVRHSKITVMDGIKMPAQLIFIWIHYTFMPGLRTMAARINAGLSGSPG